MSQDQCKFDIAWIGRCKSAANEDGVCAVHRTKKCCVCGEQAVYECDHTGQFVCGAPLCKNCEGFVESSKPGGAWGFMNHGHRQRPKT